MTGKYAVLDLFSGIGGFSLGLERTGGFETKAFCEIEPFCQRVLAKHWPGVPCYDDIRELTADRLRADGIAVDVLCGGFPCQDISVAGARVGIEGARSGLWSEYSRIIGEVRPGFVIVENVAALLSNGMGRVLGDLAALGFDAEWHCIPASAVGAHHQRDRAWIVAYPVRDGWDCGRCAEGNSGHEVRQCARCQQQRDRRLDWSSALGEDVPDADRSDQHWRSGDVQMGWGGRPSEVALDGDASRIQWLVEPDVGRVAHGVPARVDRLRGLGNAVVPQIPEIIGRAILAAEGRA